MVDNITKYKHYTNHSLQKIVESGVKHHNPTLPPLQK